MKAYLKQFVLIIVLSSLGALLAAQFVAKTPVPVAFWVCLSCIAVATFVIHGLLQDASKKRPQIFVAYFMGALTVKILLSAIMLLVVGLLDRDGLKFTAIGFLVAYVLFTILEIRHLLPLMKNEKED